MSNNEDLPLCATGCGFYGTPAQRNLCSKCFRDSLNKQTTQQTTPRTSDDNIIKVNDNVVNNVKVTNESESGADRCGSCKKRVGLMGFKCKCGDVYCGSHRYPEMHSCSFDFRTLQREGLSKALYTVAECKADKLDYRL